MAYNEPKKNYEDAAVVFLLLCVVAAADIASGPITPSAAMQFRVWRIVWWPSS